MNPGICDIRNNGRAGCLDVPVRVVNSPPWENRGGAVATADRPDGVCGQKLLSVAPGTAFVHSTGARVRIALISLQLEMHKLPAGH